MSIHRGQKHLITGGSGSSKSTLLRALIGFAEIANGRYFYQNLPMTPECMIDFRSATGFVPLELDVGRGSVDAWVQEFVPRDAHSLGRFREQCDFLQLTEHNLKQDLPQLSRGERQRLTLALVLTRQPSVLLLDEATSALSAELKQIVADHCASLNKTTIISVSHDSA